MSSPATEKGYRAGEPPANAGKSYPAEILSASQVRALIAICSKRAPSGLRNRALLVVLYLGGLRISEALALKPKDVDAAAGTLTVLHGKGDRRRTVGLDDGAFDVLARWVERRHALGLTGRQPLFCTLEGKPLKSSYVRTLLPRLARKAGIEKRMHPHGLRHAHAAELAAEGQAGQPYSGAARARLASYDGPVPAPHRPAAADRSHAGADVGPLMSTRPTLHRV